MDSLPLPQNLDAERALLGAVLEDNDALFDANRVLASSDFFEPWNANAYDLLRDQIEPGGKVSAATLLHDLSQNAIVDSNLTAKDVIEIIAREAAPRSQVATLAETIRELSRRRGAIAAYEESIKFLRSAPASVRAREIHEKLDSDITALYSGTAEFGIRRMHDVTEELMTTVDRQWREEGEVGIKLGLAQVEGLIGSLLPEKLYVLAGPSGSGKSALAQQIGETASANGHRVLYISREMPGEELVQRALTARTAIGARKISRAELDKPEMEVLMTAGSQLRTLDFYIDASVSLTAHEIGVKARRMKRLTGLDLLEIDHLQYVEKPDRRMTEVEAIGPNLRSLKQLARELRIPVLVLAQLKAGFTDGPVRRPTINDLWNSSAVEQNADAVLFVHRPEYMLARREPPKDDKEYPEWVNQIEKAAGKAEVILGKLREGQGYGVRELGFDKSRVRFTDRAERGPERLEGLPF